MSAFPGTLRRRVAVAFVVVGIVVAAAFASTTATFADLLADRSYLVDRIAPAGLAGRDFLGAMVNQESGMRGFVLTGQERFLAPYEEGRDSLIEAQERVLALVGDTPSLAVAMAGATDAAARWQRDSAEPLVAAVRSGGPEVVSEPELDESRKAFERFRSAMGELDRRLAFEREQAEERLEDSTRRLSATALGVVVLIVLGGVAVVLGLRRWVLAPLDRLGAETRAVTAGEFERPITPAGPAEIAEVAADTEAMRQRILTELAAATEAREQLATQARELAAQAEELAAQAEELA
ncbi:MAG: CHASE3 domain-containing protein, partial [Acidimicrobiia bacterium]